MVQAQIKAISYYLPENELTNQNLNNSFPEWSVDKISTKTGIYTRRIASEGEYSSDMAVAAAEKLFLEHTIDRNTIDFILFCTQSPDYFLPTTACIIQDRLKVPTSAGALDFNLGCSGFVYGLSLAKGLIFANIAKNVLLLTAETYSKFIHPQDKSNRTIFGDAAAATLITKEAGICKIKDFELGTDGAGSENLILKNRGLKNLFGKGQDLFDSEGNYLRNDNFLYMNGSEIFKFTVESVPKMIDNLLLKSGISIEEIDLFVFHQANAFMLNYIRKRMNISEEKFFLFLKDCGNTVSSTVPIALKNAVEQRRIQTNDKVLLAGFGVGYSWAATILQF